MVPSGTAQCLVFSSRRTAAPGLLGQSGFQCVRAAERRRDSKANPALRLRWPFQGINDAVLKARSECDSTTDWIPAIFSRISSPVSTGIFYARKCFIRQVHGMKIQRTSACKKPDNRKPATGLKLHYSDFPHKNRSGASLADNRIGCYRCSPAAKKTFWHILRKNVKRKGRDRLIGPLFAE
jgi:hypothetical protein